MTAPSRPARGSFAAMYETSRAASSDVGARLLRLDQLEPNPHQPRRVLEPAALAELAQSVQTYGVLQPLVVRPHPDGRAGHFEIIAGERRFHAAKKAGLEAVPAIVKGVDDEQGRQLALIENLQRENIAPLEEATVLAQILEETGLSHRALGERIGKSKTYVEQRVRMLRYPVELQAALAAHAAGGAFSPGHAKAAVQVEEPGERQALVALVEAHGLSVRETERRTRQLQAATALEPPARSRLVKRLLTPAGLTDAAFEAATVPAAAPVPDAAPEPVDLRETPFHALFEAARASGDWHVSAEAWRSALKAARRGG